MTLFALTSLAIIVAIVNLPRWWHRHRWTRLAVTSRTYLLTPSGARPDHLPTISSALEAVVAQLATHRGSGYVIHRFRDDQIVRTALTVYGVDDPDTYAQQIAVAIAAVAHPADDLTLPTANVPHYVRRADYRGRDPKDTELLSPGTAADWVATRLADAPDNVCISTAVEPANRWDRRQLRRWHMARAGRSDDMEGVGPGRACKTLTVTFNPDVTGGPQLPHGYAAQLYRFPFNTRARTVTSVRTYTANGVALLAAGGALPPTVAGTVAGIVLAAAGALLLAAAGISVTVPTSPVNRAGLLHTALHQDLLWQDIQRTYYGWVDQRRSVEIDADELSALSDTGSGNDVIHEMRDLGRAYGVQPTFATQRIDQLPQRTAAATGFGTRMFLQTEPIDAALAAADSPYVDSDSVPPLPPPPATAH